MDDAERLEEVAALADDLEQAPWVEWGLWGEVEETTSLRVRAADFANPESKYLEENEPEATPAVRLQRALGRFLGRS